MINQQMSGSLWWDLLKKHGKTLKAVETFFDKIFLKASVLYKNHEMCTKKAEILSLFHCVVNPKHAQCNKMHQM